MEVKIRRISTSLFLFALLAFYPDGARAAESTTLVLTPSRGTVKVGETLAVTVSVAAPMAVNAISARVSVPTDTLEITGTSTGGSLISFWVTGPTSDRASGTASCAPRRP